MSEEIQRLNSKLDGIGTMLKGKEEQIRRSKPRSKLESAFHDTHPSLWQQ